MHHEVYYTAPSLRQPRFKAFLDECKFKLVHDVFWGLGAIKADYKDCWILAWTDGTQTMENYAKMEPFQRINHFPGMGEICKKDSLSNNMKRMKKLLPRSYSFYPLTFCLPDEAVALTRYCEHRQSEVFIIKPDRNCQGIGIDIVKGLPNIKKYRNVVCQKYICKPLLMNRFKFDLRLYVLITSISPLKIYIYKEGLVRLATVAYKKPNAKNLHKKKMHLTNYAINKHTDDQNSEEPSDCCCKKSLYDLDKLLISSGISTSKLWSSIDGIIVKTIFSALPVLEHLFSTAFPISRPISPCFELLGFDILLNNCGEPYLLEVNRSPSLGGSLPFDKELKQNLIRNVLNMVLLTPKQIHFLKQEQHLKSHCRLLNPNVTSSLTSRERIFAEIQEQKEIRMQGNFRMLYPVEDDRYNEIRRMSFSLDSKNVDDSKTNSTAKDSPKKKIFYL
ncbi:tubulin polyglutamylase TTLL6 [Caerostris darwini]|uniref:Tubulin polyglutamylase TTLL6 n=1 Tax=Caerostris darwini TaxID=1538125 RepID=A0AAV4V556_9ARAC|nr:tubulin polyglutamylase TTLL6 [Caerostris darwini]